MWQAELVMLCSITLLLSSFFDLSFQILNLLLQLLIDEPLPELVMSNEIADSASLCVK